MSRLSKLSPRGAVGLLVTLVLLWAGTIIDLRSDVAARATVSAPASSVAGEPSPAEPPLSRRPRADDVNAVGPGASAIPEQTSPHPAAASDGEQGSETAEGNLVRRVPVRNQNAQEFLTVVDRLGHSDELSEREVQRVRAEVAEYIDMRQRALDDIARMREARGDAYSPVEDVARLQQRSAQAYARIESVSPQLAMLTQTLEHSTLALPDFAVAGTQDPSASAAEEPSLTAADAEESGADVPPD